MLMNSRVKEERSIPPGKAEPSLHIGYLGMWAQGKEWRTGINRLAHEPVSWWVTVGHKYGHEVEAFTHWLHPPFVTTMLAVGEMPPHCTCMRQVGAGITGGMRLQKDPQEVSNMPCSGWDLTKSFRVHNEPLIHSQCCPTMLLHLTHWTSFKALSALWLEPRYACQGFTTSSNSPQKKSGSPSVTFYQFMTGSMVGYYFFHFY